MKTKISAVAIGVVGILVAWWGVSTLLYYRSFTETAVGVVDRQDGKEVILRFHEERSSPAPQKVQFAGDSEYAFPVNHRTQTLKVGDKVEAYYPPGRLSEARFDRDFSYLLPGGLTAAGVVLVIVAGAILFVSGRKKPL